MEEADRQQLGRVAIKPTRVDAHIASASRTQIGALIRSNNFSPQNRAEEQSTSLQAAAAARSHGAVDGYWTLRQLVHTASPLLFTVHEDCSGRQRKEDLLARPASKKLYRRGGSLSEIAARSRGSMRSPSKPAPRYDPRLPLHRSRCPLLGV